MLNFGGGGKIWLVETKKKQTINLSRIEVFITLFFFVGGMFFLLGQWLNFKLFGIAYLVGKIKFKLFFSGSIG